MKQNILKFIFCLITSVFSINAGDFTGTFAPSFEESPYGFKEDVVIYRYFTPISNETHFSHIPNENIQAILLWMDHKDGRNLLATCKTLYDSLYQLDCPDSVIKFPFHSKNHPD